MRYSLLILFFTCAFASYQPTSAQHGGGGKRGGFSLSNLTSAHTVIPDSVLMADSTDASPRRLNAYQLTPVLGDFYESPVDTLRLNTANSTFVEARSLSIGYLGNLGSPAQTRIFRERGESRDFIFADAYDYYITTPTNAYFYDTKIPYTHATYTTGGAAAADVAAVVTWGVVGLGTIAYYWNWIDQLLGARRWYGANKTGM